MTNSLPSGRRKATKNYAVSVVSSRKIATTKQLAFAESRELISKKENS
jgi:hypothetical protein